MPFKNVVVTGADGMLGKDLVPYLRAKGYDVRPTDMAHMNLMETGDSIRQKLEALEPEVVIHCAAYTNVDGAEREPELAMIINKDGTQKLALATQDLNAIFIYISTDFVFDGLKTRPMSPRIVPTRLARTDYPNTTGS